MEKEGFFVQMKDQVTEYVEDRLLLLRLQLTEKVATASATIALLIGVLFLALLLFMIISFIAGYYLSKAVDSFPGGFGILAGVYVLLMFLLLYVHKKYTSKLIADKFVKFSFENKDNSQA